MIKKPSAGATGGETRKPSKRMLVTVQIPNELQDAMQAAMDATGYSGGQIAGECVRLSLVEWTTSFMAKQAEARKVFEKLAKKVKPPVEE